MAAPKPAVSAIEAVPLFSGESIPLDGTLSHAAWRRAPVFAKFVEREPLNGAAPKFETRVQVLVGRSALYVGVEANDANPSLIREELVRHDLVQPSQDLVTLYLDPVARGSCAQLFRVGVGGSTSDGIHSAADDTEDLSPDFDWDSAVARTASGYTIVFRIPFTSLRYTGASNGPWRILLLRRVPREVAYQLSSTPIPPVSPSIVSNMQPLLGVKTPEDDTYLTLRPYIMWRQERATPRGAPSATEVDGGVDLKWRPRSELVMDATFRPDFSQVERDVPELTRNTAFAIFRQEKRPFFLESADILRSPVNALWTRSLTRPSWGLQGTTRTETVSGTAFIARDRGEGVVLLPSAYGTKFAAQPASYVTIARGRMEGEELSIGGLASLRSYDKGAGSNVVVGPDLTWQATDNLKVRGQALASSTTALPDDSSLLHQGPTVGGHYGYASALWRTDRHEINATLDDVSTGFRDDNGFISQSGITRLNGYYNLNFRNLGPFNSLTVSISGATVREKAKDTLVSKTVIPNLTSSFGTSELIVEYLGWSTIRLSDGKPLLRERYWRTSYTQDIAAWLPQFQLIAEVGRLADVSANSVRPGSRWTGHAKLRPVRQIELELSSSLATLRNDGLRMYDEQAHQLLAVWHLAAKQSLRLIAQRASLDRLAEPALGVAAATEKTRADSLTYAWRKSAGTTLYVGATRSRPGWGTHASSSEVFVKLQLDMGETLDALR